MGICDLWELRVNEINLNDIENVRKEAALEAIQAVATTFGTDPMKARIEKKKELERDFIWRGRNGICQS